MSTSVWWIRRDMRLADNKALQSAALSGDVAPLFVVDPTFEHAGVSRKSYMYATLQELDQRMNNSLVVRYGDPVAEVVTFAKAVGATTVHIAQDFAPYGIRRDAEVKTALAAAGIELVIADSPYVLNPGTVRKDDGTPLKVFTPFFKRWLQFPFESAKELPVNFFDASTLSKGLPQFSVPDSVVFVVGEDAAWQRWNDWSAGHLEEYKEARNNPSLDGTSQLSAPLRFGVIHPRQLLQVLPGVAGADIFRSEIAWREFYADVLFHQPHTAWKNLQTKMDVLPLDSGPLADERFAAFCEGKTGYPIVDAGIRQMLATGFMHNRVRMIVASFLVKDLHLPWQWGAKFFMDHLVDGDIASNSHGWQWTAGTGTDASPYFRVFNPTSQSAKFDPTGGYIRTWVPELRELSDKDIHDPSSLGLLCPQGYIEPMVDHAIERIEALARYKAVSGK